MATQAFVYNAILLTHAMTLTKFFDLLRSETATLFMLPFGLSNFIGALVLGRLFDTIGRRAMISTTYTVAAAGFATTAYLFGQDLISVSVFVALVCAAFFYAIATGIGGAAGPAVFGSLIESQDRAGLMVGYLIAAGLMGIAAIVELAIGIKAERQALETIAQPLSAESEV